MVTKEEVEKARIKPIMCVCPFCGSYDIDPEGGLVQADGWQGPNTFPVCDNCGASAPSVEVWNKRAITTDAIRIGAKSIKEEGFIVSHKAVGKAIDKGMHSTACIAGYKEVAEIVGCETTQDFEKIKKTPVVETELGAWVNREDGFFEHIRTAEF